MTLRLRSRELICAGLLLRLLHAAGPADSVSAHFYVAVNGQNKWSGRLAAPNASRTDGPFATLGRAGAAVRMLKASGGATAPANVLVRGGTYFLDDPIIFEPEDSGIAAAPIT
jgi:hypothetical protein